VAGSLRGDEDDVHTLGSLDVAEADVETVRESEGLARCEVGLDLVVVDAALVLVGREDHDDVGPCGGVGDGLDLEAVLLRLGRGLRAILQRDGDLDARVTQVLRVGVALRAVADDGDLLALDEGEVGILVVDHFGHGGVSP